MDALDRFGAHAFRILSSPAARDAFDLDREPAAVRERYGFMPAFDPKAADRCGAPAWSQRVLLARRLVEAGVRLVTVDLRWWDTHVLGFDSLRRGFLPRFDQAYSALIEDLAERGLLESTLVVAWGEFGRTPRVNAQAGRDHYPNVFSAALAGGKVQGGRGGGAPDPPGGGQPDHPPTTHKQANTLTRQEGRRPFYRAASRFENCSSRGRSQCCFALIISLSRRSTSLRNAIYRRRTTSTSAMCSAEAAGMPRSRASTTGSMGVTDSWSGASGANGIKNV
jgi:hypothetical protein